MWTPSDEKIRGSGRDLPNSRRTVPEWNYNLEGGLAKGIGTVKAVFAAAPKGASRLFDGQHAEQLRKKSFIAREENRRR